MGFKKPGFLVLLWLLLAGLLAGSPAGNSYANTSLSQALTGSGSSLTGSFYSKPASSFSARCQPDRHWAAYNLVSKSTDQVGKSITHLHQQSFFSNFHRASSDQTGHDEKRHKKTLLSEAFVPDFSVDAPPVFYFHIDYSLFLPAGCTQKAIGNFSLRGPPSLG